MMTNEELSSLHRTIDANLNRLREGIRVVEDIYRYIYNNKEIASQLKTIRHNSRTNIYSELLEARDIVNDCLKGTTDSEKSRDDLISIIIANFKRAQESARVLEEVLKLFDTSESAKFKSIRYELYNIEKVVFK
jgi:thiamine-phosphate pyrophosphorylase